MSYKRFGGLRFVRIGRVQMSFCVTKPKPRVAPDAALRCIDGLIVAAAAAAAAVFAI